MADLALRAQAYDLLSDLAAAGKRREPGEPVWRFYEIVARTRNNPDWLHINEHSELVAMRDSAGRPADFQWARRIQQYFESIGDDPAAKRRARRLAASAAELEDDLTSELIGAFPGFDNSTTRFV